MRAAVLAAMVVSCPAVAFAGKGGAILVPPAEIDYGIGGTIGGNAVVGASSELLAGVHWASLYWKPTPIDIGVGYVGVTRDVLPGYSVRSLAPNPDDNSLHMDGLYVDLAYAIASARHFRTWVSARTEWLSVRANERSFTTHGFALRLASELYAQAVGADGRGHGFAMLAGTVALGVYVEGSHRDVSPELGPDAVTAGVSLRLPFLFAVAD